MFIVVSRVKFRQADVESKGNEWLSLPLCHIDRSSVLIL